MLTNRYSYCITIAAAVTLYVVLWRENKKRQGLAIDEEERDRLAFLDLTDKEVRKLLYRLHVRHTLTDFLPFQNPYFKYVL